MKKKGSETACVCSTPEILATHVDIRITLFLMDTSESVTECPTNHFNMLRIRTQKPTMNEVLDHRVAKHTQKKTKFTPCVVMGSTFKLWGGFREGYIEDETI